MREAGSLPPAHRGGRVISADALRILLISQKPSDGQERNQDNEDNPNVNAHHSSPCRFVPADTQKVKESRGYTGAFKE